MNAGTGGGPVCRFTVGRCGTSAACVRYITRPQAVREREKGLLLYQMPGYVTQSRDFHALRKNLVSYAWVQEARERALHQARGAPRSFYRCVLSFERSIETAKANAMAKEWLMQTFPHGRAIAALHQNTKQLHTHLWIAARETTGRKINLPARVFHSLDESWGRIYAQAFGRDPEEQRLRKEETRRHLREPHLYPRPQRSRPHWKTTTLIERNERETNEQKASEHKTNEEERQPYAAQDYGNNETGAGRSERRPGRPIAPEQSRDQPARTGEPGLARDAPPERNPAGAAERAIRETERLRDALVRLGAAEGKALIPEKGREERARAEPTPRRKDEPERER